MKYKVISILSITSGAAALALVYILQRDLFYSGFLDSGAGTVKVEGFDAKKFAAGKLLRFLINDTGSLLIIFGLFRRKDFMRFGFRLFLVELLILLPAYLVMVTYAYESTRFFLQHLHRLVVNPVLMMLLIPAFYYQLHREKLSDHSSMS
jgi:exosortase F-associated protein